MHPFLRRLLSPHPVQVRFRIPFSSSSHRGYFTSSHLLTDTVPFRPMNASTKLNLHRNLTSMSRLSLRSRTKSLLTAHCKEEVRRVQIRLTSAPLDRWTARKMTLPSVSAFVVEEKQPLSPQRAAAVKQRGMSVSPRALLETSRISCLPSRVTGRVRRPSTSSLLSATASPRLVAGQTGRAGVRQLSTIIENRMAELDGRIEGDKVIDLQLIMDDLRDLELLDKLNGVNPKSATGFKDATRALYPIYHSLDSGKKKAITYAELRAALSPVFSVPWTHIADRLIHGKVAKLAGLSAKDKASILFLRVYNVGASRAEAFVKAGARSLEDLEPLAEQKKISLHRAHKIGLRHLADIERLIPRSEMEKLKDALQLAIKTADPNFELEILGSYRRHAEFSSDIDLAVRHKSFLDKDDQATAAPLMNKIVDELLEFGLIKEENMLMSGWKKYAGFVRLPRHQHYRRIDIRLVPYKSYPYTLLGCSGDAILMKLLRHTAKEKGMTLNEYGMGKKYAAIDQNPNGFQPGSLRVVQTEREIFDVLGFPFLEPHQRDYAVWRPIYEAAGVDVSYVDKL